MEIARYGTGSGFFRTLVTAPHVAGRAGFLMILRMLEQKKISLMEAQQLLEALEGKEA